jgi:putative ABC transport system permease protein
MLLHPLQLTIGLTLFALITFVAGFYPALLMLRYKTVLVLKGTVNTAKPGKVRNTLLVVQFTISTLLIICTLVTWRQINYLQNKPLGYNKSEVISIPMGSGIDGNKTLQLFRNALNGDPNIIAITGAYDNLGRGKDGSQRTSINGFNYNGHELRSTIQKVDYDYLKTLDIKLVDGRDFSRGFATDSDAVLVNENMAKLISNKSALGVALPMDDKHPSRVIGIFKDYNFRSLHDDIGPLTLVMDKNYPLNYIFIKVKSGSLVQAFNHINQKWKETFPTIDFKGSWLNENTQIQYKKEQRLSTIFISSAIIAILISCIGLVAISVMIMVQRTKEIDIRKVLGSSVTNIVMMLSSDFIKLVSLAAIISFPIGWWVMHSWLQGFAYRIDIDWWIFAIAGIAAVIIAFVTISFQSIKAAVANPIKSLRSD